MYESISTLWQEYSARWASRWPQDDPRYDLAAEVRERLTQLDLILEYLRDSISLVASDPEIDKWNQEWALDAGSRLSAGEITHEEFASGFRSAPPEKIFQSVRAWHQVRLFTEMFYFVAWRLREILNSKGNLKFPDLREIKAIGIRNVRNSLIEHPENEKTPNFRQHLVLTSNGPVLKTSEMVVRLGTGQSEPPEYSKDQGLYVNSKEFYGELEICLSEALKQSS